ncbi:MAG: ComEC/Rec2 family competence protein [Actinomycetaceae bacterium]|nr:ComEC/Rec2 family competence protein [Actinomycetaceae bacterium]MDU0970952.1 ComEC/Rec2 family competence protein [Actinomycetaceae bacterium]
MSGRHVRDPAAEEEAEIREGARARPDARLVPVALGVWAGTLAGLAGAGWPWALAAAATAVGIALARVLSARRWLAVLAIGAAAVGVASGAHQLEVARADPLARIIQASSTPVEAVATGNVTRPWRPVRGGSFMLVVDLSQAQIPDGGTVTTRTRARVFASKEPRARPQAGDRVRLRLRATAVERSEIMGRAVGQVRVTGRSRWADVRACVLQRSRAAWEGVAGPPRGLGLGMTLGAREEVDLDVANALAAASLSHLVAVSGLHMAVVVGIALAATAPLSRRGQAVCCAATLAGYAALVGPTGSVIRAAGMAAISLVGLWMGRPHAALPALAAAVSLALLVSPELACDLGFSLSAAATAAIVVTGGPLAGALEAHGVPKKLAGALAVPIVAQLACTPLLVLVRPEIPLLGVLANLAAAPAVPLAMGAGLTVAATAPWCLPLARVAAHVAAWPLRWIILVARLCGPGAHAALPWAEGPVGAVLALGACVAAVYLWWRYDPIATTRRFVRRWRLIAGEG